MAAWHVMDRRRVYSKSFHLHAYFCNFLSATWWSGQDCTSRCSKVCTRDEKSQQTTDRVHQHLLCEPCHNRWPHSQFYARSSSELLWQGCIQAALSLSLSRIRILLMGGVMRFTSLQSLLNCHLDRVSWLLFIWVWERQGTTRMHKTCNPKVTTTTSSGATCQMQPA